jgi:hypothetical protein
VPSWVVLSWSFKRLTSNRPISTYFQVKRSVAGYQAARQGLISEGCPFSGWKISGVQWESFDVNGEFITDDDRKSIL